MGEAYGSGLRETYEERQLSQIMICSIISMNETEI